MLMTFTGFINRLISDLKREYDIEDVHISDKVNTYYCLELKYTNGLDLALPMLGLIVYHEAIGKDKITYAEAYKEISKLIKNQILESYGFLKDDDYRAN